MFEITTRGSRSLSEQISALSFISAGQQKPLWDNKNNQKETL